MSGRPPAHAKDFGRPVFVLSPADCSGGRAKLLFRRPARAPLARRLRSREGATVGEVFTFVSQLYFRGKLAYAEEFARAPAGRSDTQVIVPGLGLRPPDEPLHLPGLRAIARVPVDLNDRRYVRTLHADTERLAERLHANDFVVLLGSIATEKYVTPLTEVLGERLRVPRELIGLGSMSRGSLLLRCVREGRELTYVRPS